MTELLTAAQMRAIENAAIESGQVTGLDLMERAGRGVVEAVFEEWSELAKTPHRVVVLCGPGNNGGDGFVVARLLKERGWDVEVFLYGDAEKLPPDAKVNYERWGEMGAVHALTERDFRARMDADLYVDALFGIGMDRKTEGDLASLLRYLAGYGGDRPFLEPRLVAIDLPSGLDSDTGVVHGAGEKEWAPSCPFCRLTVTFHRPKVGHTRGRGPDHCGKLVVKDIGL